jgi:hypothetical protein
VVEALPGELHQIDLVHRHRDVTETEQRADVAVTAGLGQHALARVDEDHRGIRGGRSRGHVASVLLVTGRIRDDERPARRAEEPVRHVDRDALLAFGFEAVDEQREVDVLAGGAVLLAVPLERGELVFQDELRVVEKPSDQGGLAVIHRAARQEAQQALRRTVEDRPGGAVGHQK